MLYLHGSIFSEVYKKDTGEYENLHINDSIKFHLRFTCTKNSIFYCRVILSDPHYSQMMEGCCRGLIYIFNTLGKSKNIPKTHLVTEGGTNYPLKPLVVYGCTIEPCYALNVFCYIHYQYFHRLYWAQEHTLFYVNLLQVTVYKWGIWDIMYVLMSYLMLFWICPSPSPDNNCHK